MIRLSSAFVFLAIANICHAMPVFDVTQGEVSILAGQPAKPITFVGQDPANRVMMFSAGFGDGVDPVDFIPPYVPGDTVNIRATVAGTDIQGVRASIDGTPLLLDSFSGGVLEVNGSVDVPTGPIAAFSIAAPVTYDFFYHFSGPPNETFLARLEGSGTGDAVIEFSVDNSFGPDPVYVVTGATYTLGSAVPEPTSLVVWGLLAMVGIVCPRIRQTLLRR